MTPTDSPADPTQPAAAQAAPAGATPAGPAPHPIDTGEIDRLVDGAHHSPHSVLGAHMTVGSRSGSFGRWPRRSSSSHRRASSP
jgi:hypothetical protein